MSDLPENLVNSLADRYRIERELGAGGMATVYLAHDVRHDRKVALKVLKPDLAAVIGASRFLAEIRTTANLQNPHILPLHDSGAIDGTVFYVMPFIDGESLRDRLNREKQLPIPDAIRITTAVADALQYAHDHKVIHRDIKPENILLQGSHALVADFGIALAASTAGSRMTETGMSLGTPHYMSPEQAMGERELDSRTDIYALGCVLYETLTGEPPFTGPTAQSIVAKVITEQPVPPSRVRSTVPENVDDAVLTALAKLPADRFASAAAFAAALTSESSAPGTRRRKSIASQSQTRSFKAFAAIASLLIVALAGLSGWALTRGRGTSSVAPMVYDAALPDSAPMTFVFSQAGYGLAVRNISISPDASFAVYPVATGDSSVLWWRSLKDSQSHPIAGTEGGQAPEISPDGSRIAFLSNRRVMVVPVAGGTAKQLTIAGIPATLEWISPQQILLLHSDGNHLTWLDADAGVVKDRNINRCTLGSWVPQSKELVCALTGVAFTLDPETNKQSPVRITAPDGTTTPLAVGSDFRVVDDKYVVYMSTTGEITATTYNAATRTLGRSVSMVPGVRRESAGSGQFEIARNGTLAYAVGENAPLMRLVEMQKGKEAQPLPVEANFFQRFDLSRNRRWLAAIIVTSQGQELKVYDLKDGQSFTWLHALTFRHALWNPEGTKLLVFTRDSASGHILYGSPFSNNAPDTLLTVSKTSPMGEPVDFPDEHNVILYDLANLVAHRMDLTVRPVKIDSLNVAGLFASVAPGNKLITYQTADGRLMVTTFPPKAERNQIASGGVEPMWLSDSEVLYRSGVSWYSARVNPSTGEPIGSPVLWGKDPRFSDTSGWSNRLAHDGGIIYAQGPPQSSARFIRVVPNWVNRMKAAVDSVNR